MNIALLVISSASLVCSASCLCILVVGAKKAKQVEADVETFKEKTTRNFGRVKAVLGEMEL